MPKYRVNEIFYSLQGEGARAGTANVFVRFSGCNLQCAMEPGPKSPGGFDCDTEFSSGKDFSLEELVSAIRACGGPKAKSVILTGGEPSLQVDQELVEALRADRWYIAMETNGTKDVAALELDWVTVSPKTAEHTLKVEEANEVKYVRAVGQGLPKPKIKATHYFLSPAFSPDGTSQETLANCIEMVKNNPKWRLSVQQHKMWRVR